MPHVFNWYLFIILPSECGAIMWIWTPYLLQQPWFNRARLLTSNQTYEYFMCRFAFPICRLITPNQQTAKTVDHRAQDFETCGPSSHGCQFGSLVTVISLCSQGMLQICYTGICVSSTEACLISSDVRTVLYSDEIYNMFAGIFIEELLWFWHRISLFFLYLCIDDPKL